MDYLSATLQVFTGEGLKPLHYMIRISRTRNPTCHTWLSSTLPSSHYKPLQQDKRAKHITQGQHLFLKNVTYQYNCYLWKQTLGYVRLGGLRMSNTQHKSQIYPSRKSIALHYEYLCIRACVMLLWFDKEVMITMTMDLFKSSRT